MLCSAKLAHYNGPLSEPLIDNFQFKTMSHEGHINRDNLRPLAETDRRTTI